MKRIRSKIPGNIAFILMLLISSLWTFWGVSEMFHEGWYRPFEWIFFLIPSLISVSLTVVSLLFPKIGGSLIILSGMIFSVFVFSRMVQGGGFTISNFLSWLPVTLLFILIGILFVIEGFRIKEPLEREVKWYKRYSKVIIAILIPLVIGTAAGTVSGYRYFNRYDDGYRGERIIEGYEITLTWAGDGSGWHKSSMGNLSWNEIALYGKGPIGFEGKRETYASYEDFKRYNMFRYLNYDATELTDKVYDFWRLPTIDELTRSMYKDNKCVGCPWNGKEGIQNYKKPPDKETPLWAPDEPVIYYMSSTEADEREYYSISYRGMVIKRDKSEALGSLGFRAVRTGKRP